MEASSPLAAIQQPVLFAPKQPYLTQHAFLKPQPPRFDFKEISMCRSKNYDYFSWKPVRGSSPTASLAADFSQNLGIDHSSIPPLTTPRRSLFTKNDEPTPGPHHNALTPPIPSSSPTEHSCIDTSPLPHKVPFQPTSQPQLQNNGLPTPDPTPVADQPMTFPSTFPQDEQQQPPQPQNMQMNRPPARRRISGASRPSLRKGYSVNATCTAATTAAPRAAPFLFGTQSTKIPLESFAESPPSERKLMPSASSPSLLGGPPPTFNPLCSGSPLAVGPRRSMLQRCPVPRIGLGRRTQSLQYSSSFKPSHIEKRSCTEWNISPTLELEEPYVPKLPHFLSDNEADNLPRITKETLLNALHPDADGLPRSSTNGDMTIIDCRFEYEFAGGHIDGAQNFNDREELAQKLFSGDGSAVSSRTLVFHCEYSNHRAPIMAKFIRQRDRAINQHRYPHLTFPEIYILDGGYSSFYESHAQFCYPRNYVGMEAKEHESACERGMAKVKRRAKLTRAQTYAFGQASYGGCSVGNNALQQRSADRDADGDTAMHMDVGMDAHTTVHMHMNVGMSSGVAVKMSSRVDALGLSFPSPKTRSPPWLGQRSSSY